MNMYKASVKRESSIKKVFIICFFIGVFIVIGQAFITRGVILNHFFYDSGIHTISDFMVSLIETTGGKPYTQFSTLYPPLANLFFYVLNLLVPDSLKMNWETEHWSVVFETLGSEYDPRIHEATMILFAVYVMFISIATVLIILKIVQRKDRNGMMMAVLLSFCYGNLYALERGNIIVLSMLFTAIFVFWNH